uniref:EOG090X0GPG n=1 Tax=Evadne anonyx TaxID=141404 RepID=A0A9N6ZFL4_9CRUS|nr:EOG090X0GPG [Evadne anonyx]
MADNYSAKRKAKDKAFYIRSAKQQKNSQKELSPGMKGFMCTSNREKDSVREAYNILNEFGDIVYGCEAPKMKKVEEELEIEDELAAEIAELKKQARSTERRFQSVATGVKGCVFIKTTVDDPVKVVNAIMEHIETKHEKKTRFLLRLIPIQATCKPTTEEILQTAGALVEEHMAGYKSFSILFKVRNNNVDREAIIHPLADTVAKKYPDIKVDLNHAEVSIVIEVLRKTCCIGVVPNYNGRSKYNLVEFALKLNLADNVDSTEKQDSSEKADSFEKADSTENVESVEASSTDKVDSSEKADSFEKVDSTENVESVEASSTDKVDSSEKADSSQNNE